MAHFLIVAESEPQQIQEKADYTVPASDSAAPLQEVFDEIDDLMNGGAFSIWLAGSFELDDDVTAPSGAWIRGLGYVGGGET